MAEMLQLGALVPATVGVCCSAWPGRSRRILGALSAVVMLLAMADQATRMLGVAPIAWSALLVLLAIVSGAGLRLDAASITRHRAMTVHASLGSVVMAGLMLLMQGGPVDAGAAMMPGAAGMPGMSGMSMGPSPLAPGHAGGLLALVVAFGAVAFVAYSAVLARLLAARPVLVPLPGIAGLAAWPMFPARPVFPVAGAAEFRSSVMARLAVAEVVCMAASVALMLAMLVVP